jgi:NTE family protein
MRHKFLPIPAQSTAVPKIWHHSFIAAPVTPRQTEHMTALHEHEPKPNRRLAGALRTPRVPLANGGSSAALALGGGFSRGFAHLGVLGVLEEEQIPFSLIVGTSVGGLLGAAYADGISLQDLCDLGRHVRVRDFLRFQQSEQGAPKQKKDCIGKFVQEWFRAKVVEDLPIQTVIVTTDLDTGAPYLFTRGPIDVAMRATCAFPGLVKPVEYDNRRLADGCIVAPVPTAIAARINGGCVVGVSVGSNASNPPAPESTANVFDPRSRALHRNALKPSWSRHADILLEPQVRHIDWNDFARVDEAFAAGAEAMRRALPSLRELLDRRSLSEPAVRAGFGPERGVAL